jgi:hypothetical protein
MTGGKKPFWYLRRRSRQIAAEVDEELRTHLAMRVEELVSRGMPRGKAEREAIRQFGDVEETRRYCHSQDEEKERAVQRQLAVMDVFDDIRIALRGLVRTR